MSSIKQELFKGVFWSAVEKYSGLVVSLIVSIRDKRFKEIAKRTLSLQILTGSVSVCAAFYGAGVYALLISPVITAIRIFTII